MLLFCRQVVPDDVKSSGRIVCFAAFIEYMLLRVKCLMPQPRRATSLSPIHDMPNQSQLISFGGKIDKIFSSEIDQAGTGTGTVLPQLVMLVHWLNVRRILDRRRSNLMREILLKGQGR